MLSCHKPVDGSPPPTPNDQSVSLCLQISPSNSGRNYRLACSLKMVYSLKLFVSGFKGVYLRALTEPRPVKVYPPPPSTRKACKDPVAQVTQSQLAVLDPKGERKALFDYRRNARSIKPGDIVRVTFKNGDPFNGAVLSIKLRGIDTSFLLRNELSRTGVEMSVKVFNPNVSSVEIVQRAERKPRRARLYYMRFVDPQQRCIAYYMASVFTDFACPGLASTTVAAWRTLCPPTSARRGPSLVDPATRGGELARTRRSVYCISKDVLLSVYIQAVSIPEIGDLAHVAILKNVGLFNAGRKF